MRSLVHQLPAAKVLVRHHSVSVALSLLASVAQSCSLDTRDLIVTDGRATQPSDEAGAPGWPEPDAEREPGTDGDDIPPGDPTEPEPDDGGSDVGSQDEPTEPGMDAAQDAGTPEPVDCCTLPVASGGCAEIDETCGPAARARMEQVRSMTRGLLHSSAFAECLNRTMRIGESNVDTAADSVPSGGCGGQTPDYEQTGYGPYVSCRPEPDLSQGGQPIAGTSNGDPAWNELIDRQLARLLNALRVEIALTPVAAPADAGIRNAGYDAMSGISHVTYPGLARSELTLDEAHGEPRNGVGFVPDVIRATLRNLGYDNGCYPDAQPLGKDHGNCGRDPVMWHPDRALANIAAFCAKEVLLRSASTADWGCGTKGSGAQQTLRPCPQGLMMVTTYQAFASEFPCQCVPDPAAFGARAAGERFGAAFAVGDFDGDIAQDLAVGAPNALFPGRPGRGGVFLYRGSRLGLQPWRSVSSAELGLGRDDAECGATLAAGYLGTGAAAALVIGCPGYESGQGRVAILPGCRSDCPDQVAGPQVALAHPLTPHAPGEFGRALAIGKFLGDDDLNDLFVGAPAAAGMVPLAGRVEMYRGLAEGPPVDHDDTLEGVDTFDRFGAALAIGDVQGTPGNELLVGAPGTLPGSANPAGGGVVVVSPAGIVPLQTSLQEGGGFGSAIAIGDLFGDDFDDIIITAPGEGKLYRSIGASARPDAPAVVASYPTDPATAVAVVMAQVFSPAQLVLVGRPGANQATLYRPSGSELAVDRHLHPSALPFWSAAHDPLDDGHCSKRGDLAQDVPCAIDAVTLPGQSFGSAVGAGLFGMGVQFVIGAPDENVGIAPTIPAGAVFVRGGQRSFDATITWIDPLEARLDREAILHSGTPYARSFGPATRWHDDLCGAGESCTTRVNWGRADVVVWSRDAPGKQGEVSVAPSTLTSFGPAVPWQDNLCSERALCTIGNVDGGGEEELVVFVRDAIVGHEYHVHVVRCAGCAVEEWHNDFCHDGNVCLVGELGEELGGRFGDDIIEIDPKHGAHWIGLSTASQDQGFVVAGGVFSSVLCADGHLCLLADANGDNRDDLVEFFQGDSPEVWVAPALQNRVGFGPARKWHRSFCSAGEQCRVGDVNGDQFDDLVSFVREATPGYEGNVWVSLSNGVDFGPAELWHPDLCRGAQTCELGDVNGDTRSDAVVFVGSAPGSQNNDVNVALSLP